MGWTGLCGVLSFTVRHWVLWGQRWCLADVLSPLILLQRSIRSIRVVGRSFIVYWPRTGRFRASLGLRTRSKRGRERSLCPNTTSTPFERPATAHSLPLPHPIHVSPTLCSAD